jgi:hypothetical protein
MISIFIARSSNKSKSVEIQGQMLGIVLYILGILSSILSEDAACYRKCYEKRLKHKLQIITEVAKT